MLSMVLTMFSMMASERSELPAASDADSPFSPNIAFDRCLSLQAFNNCQDEEYSKALVSRYMDLL